MAKIYKLGFVAALGLGVALSAFGQGRGMSTPTRAGSAPGRAFSAPGRAFAGARPRGSGAAPGVLRPGFFVPPLVGTPLNPNFAPIRGVPGLGFDFQHLAAIEESFRDRFGHRRRGLFFTPLFFDALPLSYPYDNEYAYEEGEPDYYTQAAQQPLYVMPAPQSQPATAPPAETAPRATAPETAAPPPPELGQLILVRRDGQVLLAVAFAANQGQLTYVTREGTRRSFPISELDKDATRQMNDANGTSVSLPE